MSKFEQYEHHGKMVWVETELKGGHRERNLCFSCKLLGDCEISTDIFDLCVKHNLVIPTAECPNFIETKEK